MLQLDYWGPDDGWASPLSKIVGGLGPPGLTPLSGSHVFYGAIMSTYSRPN